MVAVLSPDMQAQKPHLNLKTKVLRSHKETMVHPLFRWIKREIEVVDLIKYVSIVFTQQGRSFEIPLDVVYEEEKQEDAN